MNKKFIGLILAFGFLVYFHSLFNGFVWDDEELILNNLQVHSVTNVLQFFSGSTFNSGGGGNLAGLYYKPFMVTAFSLIYTFFGPQSFFFHFFQVGLHLANSVFIFFLLRYFFKKDLWPFFLALVFLVHPINTETVVYIADLQDTLFLFFGLLAFLIVTYKKVTLRMQATVAGLFLFSLLSKETGIVILLVTFIYLLFFQKEKLKALLPAAVFSIASYSFLRFAIAGIGFNKHGLTAISTMPLSERLINIPKIIVFYLQTFFWPANLAINQQWAVRTINFPDFWLPFIITLIFLFILIAGGIFLRKKKGDFAIYIFFLLWFTIALGFHLQIFPLDLTVSDRWFYLPMVGFLGMGGVYLNRLTNKILIIILLLLIPILSWRTFLRTLDWRDGLTLYSHDIKISHDAFDLENNLGVELFRTGNFQEAEAHFQRSTELSPNWWTNWNNLGAIMERKGDYRQAKEDYLKAIQNGNYYLAYENYAGILLFRDQNPREAKQFCEQSLKKLPLNAKLWLVLAISDYKLNQTQDALAAAGQAYTLNPNQQTAYVYRQISQNLPLEFQ